MLNIRHIYADNTNP